MTDISILPNPFKMLDLEREKRLKSDEKCNSCEDDKKEGFNNLKKDKPVVEGLSTEFGSFISFFLVLLGSSGLASFAINKTYLGVYKKCKYDLENKLESGNSEETYKEAYKDAFVEQLIGNNKLTHLKNLLTFVGFSAIAYCLNLEDEVLKDHKNKFLIVGVGFMMYALKFIPAIIEFFENTIGYALLHIPWWLGNTPLNLNLYMQSDNFKGMVDNNEDVSINFNKLITLFNIENLGEKFSRIRMDKKDEVDKKNTSDFFVSFNANQNEPNTQFDFFEYLLKMCIKKRTYGETSWLIITTLLTAGIFKSMK